MPYLKYHTTSITALGTAQCTLLICANPSSLWMRVGGVQIAIWLTWMAVYIVYTS